MDKHSKTTEFVFTEKEVKDMVLERLTALGKTVPTGKTDLRGLTFDSLGPNEAGLTLYIKETFEITGLKKIEPKDDEE